MIRFVLSLLVGFQVAAPSAAGAHALDFGNVREEHIMIPMRDGKRLSAYVFFPEGRGKVAGDLRAALRGHHAARARARRRRSWPRAASSSRS